MAASLIQSGILFMVLILSLLIAIVSIVIGILILLLDPITIILLVVNYDTTNGECYFSSNYYEARETFIKNAIKAKATLHSYPLSINSNLTTDIAIIEGSHHKYLIHISGVHGTEGYAGSAIQSASLEYFSNNQYNNQYNNDNPTIVFIHIVNPYGMANNRRVNEDNIDLNRNFLSLNEFEKVLKREPNFAGYVDIDYLINPTSLPYSYTILNDLHSFGLTIHAAIKYGLNFIKRALVSGNYFKKSGLGYGGDRLSKSGANVVEVLINQLNIGSKAKSIVLLDVHTGIVYFFCYYYYNYYYYYY
jgi:hypothetical protein